MSSRLPDGYFASMYAGSEDPWQLTTRWYEQRKYAITIASLPNERYRHAFEPGCSVGALTELLARRCDRVTSMDIADAALRTADRRLTADGCRERIELVRGSIDKPWPAGNFDLVVLSEVAYYLSAATLAEVVRREVPALAPGATVVAAHWRHRVADYPQSGDEANAVIAATPGLFRLGGYVDDDVVIDVFDTAASASVAERTGVPGSSG